MAPVNVPYEQIYDLWFGGLEFGPGKPFPMAALQRWYQPSEEFDRKCSYSPPPTRTALDKWLTVRVYEPLIRQLVELPFPSLLELSSTPEKSLVVIILLDHIARNANRGEKQAWVLTTADPVTLKLADHCIKQGHDMAVPPHKRHFYYFPYMRSEDLAHQELSLAKNAMLVWDTRHIGWDASVPAAQKGLDHVIKFYRIIEKYGRFPYRNAVLKRENTAEEQKFMDEGGFKFVLEG